MLSRLMTRREQAVIIFLAAATVIGAVTLYAVRGGGAGADVPTVESPESGRQAVAGKRDSPSIPAAVTNTGEHVESELGLPRAEVVVSLVGAVSRPGVYTLDARSRVQDLLRVAGGLVHDADTSDINLAANLIDGTTLIVPGRDELAETDRRPAIPNIAQYTISRWPGGPSNGIARSSSSYAGSLIDLNQATARQLETLPGIGPKLAEEIIRYRTQAPLARVSDVMNVSGIGPKRFEAIQSLVTVQ